MSSASRVRFRADRDYRSEIIAISVPNPTRFLIAISSDYPIAIASERRFPSPRNDNFLGSESAPVGWAGVYWQHPADNWGEKPGATVRGATKLVFRAIGQRGGEIVEFKSGGISDRKYKYKDSYEVSTGRIALTREWKTYEIRLPNLTNRTATILGAFAWVSTGADNPGGLTFYLDGLRIE